MLRTVARKVATGLVIVLASAGVARAQTNFAEDVNSALDHFLDYARSQIDAGNLNSPCAMPSIDPVGLVGLTIMEKHDLSVPGNPILGYSNASATDKTRLQNIALGIINCGNHVQRGSFYAYVDGADMMFLSLYARTGGPDPVGGLATVRGAMDTLVDRTRSASTSRRIQSPTGGAARCANTERPLDPAPSAKGRDPVANSTEHHFTQVTSGRRALVADRTEVFAVAGGELAAVAERGSGERGAHGVLPARSRASASQCAPTAAASAATSTRTKS